MSHESTPPRISIEDGSMTISVRTRPTPGPGPPDPFGLPHSTPQEHVYKSAFNAPSHQIEYIRVLHGSGRLLYEDLSANGSVVTLRLGDDPTRAPVGEVEFSESIAIPNQFKIVSRWTGAGDGRLNYLGHGNPPGRRKDRHKWEHRGGGPGREFLVTSIEVRKPSGIVFRTDLNPAHPFESQEFRVLIWLPE